MLQGQSSAGRITQQPCVENLEGDDGKLESEEDVFLEIMGHTPEKVRWYQMMETLTQRKESGDQFWGERVIKALEPQD